MLFVDQHQIRNYSLYLIVRSVRGRLQTILEKLTSFWGGGGGGFRLVTFSDVLTKKHGGRTPTTFDINDVMGGGGGGGVIMKRQNDVIFSKIVRRRPLRPPKITCGRILKRLVHLACFTNVPVVSYSTHPGKFKFVP